MLGYDQFKIAVKRFRSTLMLGAGGSAIVPVLADLSGLSPPWPPNVAALTSLFSLCCVVVVFQILRRKHKLIIDAVIIASAGIFFTFMFGYIYFFTRFTYVDPVRGVRTYMGCEWTMVAKLTAEKYGAETDNGCPGQYHEILEAANFNNFDIWTSSSIDNIQFTGLLLWMVSFISLSTLISSFVTYQSEVK